MTNAVFKEPERTGVYVAPFEQLRMTDVESVGGKNASLGEMISQLADHLPEGSIFSAHRFDIGHAELFEWRDIHACAFRLLEYCVSHINTLTFDRNLCAGLATVLVILCVVQHNCYD